MNNLESDESSLVTAAKRLKIMVSDKVAHSANVLYHQAVVISSLDIANQVRVIGKTKTAQKAKAEKMFLMLLKTQVINQKSCFLLRDQLKTWTYNLPEESSLPRHMILVKLFRERDDRKSYRIGTRYEPPSLTKRNIVFEKDWLDMRLDFDLASCMAANHGNDEEIEMSPFESWSVFKSMATDKRTIQSDLDYFPVIPTK